MVAGQFVAVFWADTFCFQ